MTAPLRLRLVLFLGISVLVSCQSSRSRSADTADSAHPGNIEARLQIHSSDGAPRDLSQDEAAGGHVLRKHVGRTDDELRRRLERERNITGASTYSDRATAERVIGNAIGYNKDRIERWLRRPGGHANLVLDYDADGPIGRTLNRGGDQPQPCSHAVVVLKYDPPSNYHVLTSYPECRS